MGTYVGGSIGVGQYPVKFPVGQVGGGYGPPVYQQPVAQKPVFQYPVYQKPVYQQPVYQHQVYQKPVYQYRPPVSQFPVVHQRPPVGQFPSGIGGSFGSNFGNGIHIFLQRLQALLQSFRPTPAPASPYQGLLPFQYGQAKPVAQVGVSQLKF